MSIYPHHSQIKPCSYNFCKYLNNKLYKRLVSKLNSLFSFESIAYLKGRETAYSFILCYARYVYIACLYKGTRIKHIPFFMQE